MAESEAICTTLNNIPVVANFPTLSWRGECRLPFKRKLAKVFYQVTYIQFQRGGASNDYPGMRIMSVLIPRNRLYELSLIIVTDDHRKVTTTPGKDNYSTH